MYIYYIFIVGLNMEFVGFLDSKNPFPLTENEFSNLLKKNPIGNLLKESIKTENSHLHLDPQEKQ